MCANGRVAGQSGVHWRQRGRGDRGARFCLSADLRPAHTRDNKSPSRRCLVGALDERREIHPPARANAGRKRRHHRHFSRWPRTCPRFRRASCRFCGRAFRDRWTRFAPHLPLIVVVIAVTGAFMVPAMAYAWLRGDAGAGDDFPHKSGVMVLPDGVCWLVATAHNIRPRNVARSHFFAASPYALVPAFLAALPMGGPLSTPL